MPTDKVESSRRTKIALDAIKRSLGTKRANMAPRSSPPTTLTSLTNPIGKLTSRSTSQPPRR